MKCPVCGATLLMSERHGVEIDYCPECRGIWLDRGELDKIIERAAEESGMGSTPKENHGGFIVGGDNYGQGSSREHAALVPNYLKIRAIFALSFARIHRSNLINNGILPIVIDQKGYDFFNEEDEYVLLNVKESVEKDEPIIVQNVQTKETISTELTLAPREKVMILQGGLLNAIKELGGDF